MQWFRNLFQKLPVGNGPTLRCQLVPLDKEPPPTALSGHQINPAPEYDMYFMDPAALSL
jgi:hypothetical protein